MCVGVPLDEFRTEVYGSLRTPGSEWEVGLGTSEVGLCDVRRVYIERVVVCIVVG